MSKLTTIKPLIRNRTNLLESFLTKYSPQSLPLNSSTTPLPYASTSSLNPFFPTKTPGSNSSTGPKYSIRRQKVLRKQLDSLNLPNNLLPPSYLKATKSFNRGIIEGSGQSRAIGSSTYKSVNHLPSTKILDGLNLEKKGPYLGRKGASFKGKIWERKMSAREDELKLALAKAPAKEAAWRKVSTTSDFFLVYLILIERWKLTFVV